MIHHDKALHVIYGAAAACVGAVLAVVFGWPALILAPLAALVVGVAKEVYDERTGRKTPDYLMDVLATFAGCAPVVVGLLVGAA